MKKILLLLMIIALMLMSIGMASAVLAEEVTLAECNDTINYDLIAGNDGAQSWNTTITATMSKVYLYLKETSGTPTTNLTISLRTGTDIAPNSTDDYSGWYVEPSQVSGSYQKILLRCDPSQTCSDVTIHKNTRYWAYIAGNSQYTVGMNVGSGTYPGGNSWSAATPYPNNDVPFIVMGTIEEPETSSSGSTRYIVDEEGNLVGIQQGQQLTLIDEPEKDSPFLSVGGGSSFDLAGWLKNLWASFKEAFVK